MCFAGRYIYSDLVIPSQREEKKKLSIEMLRARAEKPICTLLSVLDSALFNRTDDDTHRFASIEDRAAARLTITSFCARLFSQHTLAPGVWRMFFAHKVPFIVHIYTNSIRLYVVEFAAI